VRIDKRQRRHSSESKPKISNRSEKSVSCGNRHNEEKDSKERYKTAATKHSKDREKDRENETSPCLLLIPFLSVSFEYSCLFSDSLRFLSSLLFSL
jgi:hypothetical protein